MPLEPRASWFSPKCVEAQQLTGLPRGKALFRCGPRKRYQIEANSEYWIGFQKMRSKGQPVRQWGISFIVERETAQITS